MDGPASGDGPGRLLTSMFRGVVVVVVDSSSFVFKSPRQTSAWGPGKKRGRRFKRPREKKTLPPSASSSPLPSRLKMRVAGQSPTHGQSEARRGVTAPACKRPAPAVRQWSGVAGVSRAAWPPPKTSSTEAFWAHKGLFFFVLVPVVGAKVEIGPHFFSLVHFHSEMAVSLSPFGPWIQPLSGDAVAAATPTSLPVPLYPPMRGTWTTRQTKISLFSICRWFGPIGRGSTCCRRSHLHGCTGHSDALDRRD